MKLLKTIAPLFLLSLVLGCGQQLVEFANPGAPDSGSPDAIDEDATNPDVATTDTGNADDLGSDATSEAGPDLTTSDAADATGESGPNVVTSDAADATSDASLDGAALGTGDATRAGDDAADAGMTGAGGDAADSGATDAGSDAADAGMTGAGGDAADASPTDAGLDAGEAGLPVVVSTDPANGATGVSIAKILTAMFNVPMDPTTFTATTFTLQQGLTPVSGLVSAVGSTATFVPTMELASDTIFTATITTGVEDVFGTPMANSYSWTFTTSACGQAQVVLASAGNFVVLAGSTVTSTGPTSVIGDLGVSPGTAITGFPPGTIVGNLHAGDSTSAQGVADLTTAYNDAASRTRCAVTVAGNLGGLTLTPGLYTSTSSLAISAGDLTLDAQGDPNAVFIFQTASTLTTTPGRQVILSGAAKSTNVFWQIGTSATLGTTSVFQGIIMANQAITLDTGATLNGRALARIAAVALDSNIIVKPTP
jgi:hypothetical protein